MLVIAVTSCQQKEEPRPQNRYSAVSRPGAVPDNVQLLRDTLQKDPKNVATWITLGDVLMDSSRCNEAIDAYQKALALNPKNVDVRVDMGTCYRNIGKPDVAMKEYRKALEIRPNHPTAHRNLGVVLSADLKDRAGGAREFERYLELAPNAPDAGQVRAQIDKLKAGK